MPTEPNLILELSAFLLNRPASQLPEEISMSTSPCTKDCWLLCGGVGLVGLHCSGFLPADRQILTRHPFLKVDVDLTGAAHDSSTTSAEGAGANKPAVAEQLQEPKGGTP